MSFILSLVIILGFIVPGLWVVLAGAVLSRETECFLRQLLVDPSLARATLLLASAFVLGAMIDSARVVVLDGPIDISRNWYFFLRNFVAGRFRFLRLTQITPPVIPRDYLVHLTEKSLPVFQFLIERTQEYYRFNANSFLGIICLIVAKSVQGQSEGLPLLYCLAALFYFAAFKNRGSTLYAMQQFSRSGDRPIFE